MEKKTQTSQLIAHHQVCRKCRKVSYEEILDKKEELCDQGVHLLLGSLREYVRQRPS